jgi:hypothetical protein
MFSLHNIFKKKQEISTISDHLPACNIVIADIDTWILKDFIQCRFFGNLSSIGTGSKEQLSDAFNTLMAQYVDFKGDEAIQAYATLRGRKARIELQWTLIDNIAKMMQVSYDADCAATLREMYSDLGYEFSPTSYIKDFEMIAKAELTTKFTYDELTKQIEDLDKGATDKEIPLETQYGYFLDLIVQLEKHLGFRLNKNEITVSELAKYEKDYHAEYKRLLEQHNKLKHG